MPLEKTMPISFDHMRALMRQLDEELARLAELGVAPADVPAEGLEARVNSALEFAKLFLINDGREALAERVLGNLMQVAGARRGFLSLVEPEEEPLDAMQSHVKDEPALRKVERLARSMVTRHGTETAPLFVPLPSHDPALADGLPQGGLGPLALVPFEPEDGIGGALWLERSPSSAPFQAADVTVLRPLMRYLAMALPAVRRAQEQQDSRLQLDLLNRLYEAMSRSLDLDQLLDYIAQVTLEITESERAFILLMAGGQLYFGSGRDASGPLTQQSSRDISRSVCRKVVEEGEGVYVYDMAQTPEYAETRSAVTLQINSVVAVPLNGQDGVTGVLYIDSRGKLLNGLQRKLSVLSNIARVASLAVESAKLYRQATVDTLTGMYVRSFFMLRLEEEIRRSQRYSRGFSLVLLDIDHFKSVNDAHGHQTGDDVLECVAQAVKRSIRSGVDLPGRYGGDELVVILPETPEEGALIVAERIRQNVAEAEIPTPSGGILKASVSLGLAVFPEMGDSANQLFAHADQALHQAKQEGRNRVIVFREPG